jgi:DNA polymerase III subunit alpha
VSDHPLSPYADLLRERSSASLGSIDDADVFADGKTYDFAGMVSACQIKTTKKKDLMAVLTLEDLAGSVTCVVWPKMLADLDERGKRSMIEEDSTLVVRGRLERGDRGAQVIVDAMAPLDPDSTGRRGPSSLSIHLRSEVFSETVMTRLSGVFENYPGAQPVTLFIERPDGRKFRAELPVQVNCESPELLAQVGSIVGEQAVEMV